MKKKPRPSLVQRTRSAQRRLGRILGIAQKIRSISRLQGRASPILYWAVSVRLVGAKSMRALNARYRKKDSTTDVLSFPTPEPFCSAGILGELVICQPVLERQAREQGHSTARELDVLLVHGLLHLLGLDHERGGAEERRMRRLENELLEAIRPGSRGLIHRST